LPFFTHGSTYAFLHLHRLHRLHRFKLRNSFPLSIRHLYGFPFSRSIRFLFRCQGLAFAFATLLATLRAPATPLQCFASADDSGDR
jgi:hypothetical protein